MTASRDCSLVRANQGDSLGRLGSRARESGRVGVSRAQEVEAVMSDQPLYGAVAIGCVVTRDRRVAVNEMVVRTGEQTW